MSFERGDGCLDNMPFGEFLRFMIKIKGFTFAEFRRQIELSKTYLVDIEKGDAYPPPNVQIKMTEILQLTDEEKRMFYDKAALGRKELPVDVFKYLYSNSEAINKVRESIKI